MGFWVSVGMRMRMRAREDDDDFAVGLAKHVSIERWMGGWGYTQPVQYDTYYLRISVHI